MVQSNAYVEDYFAYVCVLIAIKIWRNESTSQMCAIRCTYCSCVCIIHAHTSELTHVTILVLEICLLQMGMHVSIIDNKI